MKHVMMMMALMMLACLVAGCIAFTMDGRDGQAEQSEPADGPLGGLTATETPNADGTTTTTVTMPHAPPGTGAAITGGATTVAGILTGNPLWITTGIGAIASWWLGRKAQKNKSVATATISGVEVGTKAILAALRGMEGITEEAALAIASKIKEAVRSASIDLGNADEVKMLVTKVTSPG